jgi:hypothetical protein
MMMNEKDTTNGILKVAFVFISASVYFDSKKCQDLSTGLTVRPKEIKPLIIL